MSKSKLAVFLWGFFLSVLALSEVPEMSCPDVKNNLQHWKLVDVRTPEEFSGDLGHIAGAELVTLGSELTSFLKKQNPDEKIIFICRNGSRSVKAARESKDLGLRHTVSMRGGMLEWNRLGFPVQK